MGERKTEAHAYPIIDALPGHIAVLNGTGTIVAVNAAWSQFAAANSAAVERTGVGVNYLAVCEAGGEDEAGDAASAELELAIKALMRGETYLSPAASKHIVTGYVQGFSEKHASPLPHERLTARQREVLQLAAEEHTSKKIADRLNVSLKTVEAYRAQLMKQLSVSAEYRPLMQGAKTTYGCTSYHNRHKETVASD